MNENTKSQQRETIQKKIKGNVRIEINIDELASRKKMTEKISALEDLPTDLIKSKKKWKKKKILKNGLSLKSGTWG